MSRYIVNFLFRKNNKMSFYTFEEIYSSDLAESFDTPTPFSPTVENEESYSKVKVLGRGAFGEAVLYRKTTTNDLVVWKEINLQRASDKDRAGALNEVEILSFLDHINIIAYYNHFFDGTSLFIEMEYANDGSLHHKVISQNGKLFPESDVLSYFYQLVSAVSYIHNYGILHRDIKTLNIFMTKAKFMKLGDFGISKVLEETYGNAETCVGTPYYMSPEIVRGETYNQKSDVWACGCVLFEIMTLKKVFQASNQLKLITSILESDIGEISDQYSQEIRDVVKHTLEKSPEDRPTTEELTKLPVFDLAKEFVNSMPKAAPLLRISSQRSVVSTSSAMGFSSTSSAPLAVSTLSSDVFCWGGGKVLPQKLELFSEGSSGMKVSAGFSHFAVITIEKEVFTWANIQGGTEIVGQLGYGNMSMYRAPKKVDFFNGISIKKVACGEDFTVFLTETGDVYTCGSDYSGCIGCEGALGDNVLIPYKVEALAGKNVVKIACGDSHVIAVTDQYEVYAWGCGEYGRLGVGHENDCDKPQLVSLPHTYSSIVDVSCGRDNSFLLTSQGNLLAFGSNENNKMALNQTVHLKSHKDSESDHVHYATVPTHVKSLRSYKLVMVAAGMSHSAALDEYGRLLTFGSNKHGQLGLGDYKPRASPSIVRGDLNGKEVVLCACGDEFTVAATMDNHLYSWGSGQNGRLGIQVQGKNSCSTPKPIFGSLHKVASLSSRYWSTIILAEKVLSSKLIHTQEMSMSDEIPGKGRHYSSVINESPEEESFKFNINFDDSKPSLEKQDTIGDSSSSALPPWLADEMENADYIPMEKTQNNDKEKSSKVDDCGDESEIPPWLADEMKNAEFIPVNGNNDGEINGESDDKVFGDVQEMSVRKTFEFVRNASKSSETCPNCLARAPSVLEIKVQELEVEKLQLLKRIKEQEILIKKLEAEQECYRNFSGKLIEVTKSVPEHLENDDEEY